MRECVRKTKFVECFLQAMSQRASHTPIELPLANLKRKREREREREREIVVVPDRPSCKLNHPHFFTINRMQNMEDRGKEREREVIGSNSIMG